MDSQHKPTFSAEFFPPKTDKGRENLEDTLAALKPLDPEYVSCTYGAGGTTQEGTFDTVQQIMRHGIPAAPHITCIGSTKAKIAGLLKQYMDAGVSRVVALRGDLPEGMSDPGEFHYANELVKFIRDETGEHFHIEVAAYPEMHPQSASMQEELLHFARKAEAGANSAITQYFFNADAWAHFVEDCERLGVTIPIVPGIMPITNYKQLARFSAGCGAEIPRWITTRLEGYGDDLDAIRDFGFDVTLQLCEQLLDAGAPSLHFYSMNRAEPTARLCKELGL
ncbi:MAG: methylenetetrahydrofolate reductase [NAD(P)H] [Granulosicoccaceae bacterium]|jgi:methylenetetrahydrofolate reductase (NADPH)